MNKTNNPRLTKNAQFLRKNMTKEERRLWYDFLKNLPQVFNRQKVIGKYIVDFYCASVQLAIEIDGSQHFEERNILYDKERDEYLNSIGITVLRYTNLEINFKFKEVCEDIINNIDTNDYIDTSPPPDGRASPQGEA
ncbi:MAG: endonuclease domain-containing protein [Clostridiales bacterium]|nr:endonuclease domain-containing protein [Clostridiales bacterium]